ncbi:ATP-dependent DEAD/H RNA helicase, putative [Trypanosoma cruzi]|nr:ATP-dependent DEAD/H RNA helicase, putative [Trypanosoma cruzi]
MVMMGRTLSGRNALLDFKILKLHGNVLQVDRTSFCEAFRHVGGAARRSLKGCSVLQRRGCPRIVSAMGGLKCHDDPPADPACCIHRTGRSIRIGKLGILCVPQANEQDASHA